MSEFPIFRIRPYFPEIKPTKIPREFAELVVDLTGDDECEPACKRYRGSISDTSSESDEVDSHSSAEESEIEGEKWEVETEVGDEACPRAKKCWAQVKDCCGPTRATFERKGLFNDRTRLLLEGILQCHEILDEFLYQVYDMIDDSVEMLHMVSVFNYVRMGAGKNFTHREFLRQAGAATQREIDRVYFAVTGPVAYQLLQTFPDLEERDKMSQIMGCVRHRYVDFTQMMEFVRSQQW